MGKFSEAVAERRPPTAELVFGRSGGDNPWYLILSVQRSPPGLPVTKISSRGLLQTDDCGRCLGSDSASIPCGFVENHNRKH